MEKALKEFKISPISSYIWDQVQWAFLKHFFFFCESTKSFYWCVSVARLRRIQSELIGERLFWSFWRHHFISTVNCWGSLNIIQLIRPWIDDARMRKNSTQNIFFLFRKSYHTIRNILSFWGYAWIEWSIWYFLYLRRVQNPEPEIWYESWCYI